MQRPLKWGILGAGTIILSGDIHNFILCMVRIFMNQTLGTLRSLLTNTVNASSFDRDLRVDTG